MKRIFKKKLEKEIQKVASFSEDKQHCLDIIYDHNRKEPQIRNRPHKMTQRSKR